MNELSNYRCDVCGEQATCMTRDLIQLLPEHGDRWKKYEMGELHFRCAKHGGETIIEEKAT